MPMQESLIGSMLPGSTAPRVPTAPVRVATGAGGWREEA
jgi:hypothetical protein